MHICACRPLGRIMKERKKFTILPYAHINITHMMHYAGTLGWGHRFLHTSMYVHNLLYILCEAFAMVTHTPWCAAFSL